MERAICARVHGLHATTNGSRGAHEGVRAAVSAALDYSLSAMAFGEPSSPNVPVELLVQARVAGRRGLSLDTLLRRYFVGHALFVDFLVEEAREDDLIRGPHFQHLLRTQAYLFDRLISEVSEEHSQGAIRPDTAEKPSTRRIERMLAGERLYGSDLDYDFQGTHMGLIAVGRGAIEATRRLATALDCRLLLVPRDEHALWAWLGFRRDLDLAEFESRVLSTWPERLALAIGEPGCDLTGWRLTHHQAHAALPIAMSRSGEPIRYADVALLASILQDHLVATSLREIYLAPLESSRDGGAAARRTLRAYFTTGGNISSAAAMLDVNRRTVTNRLQGVERRLGRPLHATNIEIQAALRLDEFYEASAAAP
jgi:PucR C-terminal helix-turn-helix domain/GGDEF-like domain